MDFSEVRQKCLVDDLIKMPCTHTSPLLFKSSSQVCWTLPEWILWQRPWPEPFFRAALFREPLYWDHISCKASSRVRCMPTGIKEKGDSELQFSSLCWRWSSFIWQQMAQNHLRSGFQSSAQGQSSVGGRRLQSLYCLMDSPHPHLPPTPEFTYCPV